MPRSSSARGDESDDDRRRPLAPERSSRYLLLTPEWSSSRREPSRDGRRRGSTYEVTTTSRYLSPASSSTRRERSREGSRRRSAGEVASVFRYSTLDPQVKRAIRVIRIRPDLDHDMIACDIEYTTTTSTYSALSYTWGSHNDDHHSILIDGHLFTVRENLWTFLRHARNYHAGKALWIDAICIDQDNVQEKNRQVQMMSKIYSESKEVLLWLGPKLDYVGHAIRRMEAYDDMGDTEMALSSAKDDDFWKGFKAMNSATYWERVWVIQELIQPRKGRIIQGDRWVSFETFQNTIRRFDNRIYRLCLKHWTFGPRRNEFFSDYISHIHPLWQRRIDRGGSPTSRAVDADWALLSGSRFCTNIRDRVYGIMPLATHGSSLRVDYDLNPFELLLESIWLEHDTEIDRTELLMNLANILMLSPASMCLYAQRRTSRADRLVWKLPEDAERMHLKAASSLSRQEAWLHAASKTGEIAWRNFARDQRLAIPKGMLQFPSRRQCPWHMFIYTSTGSNNLGLKLAVDSRSVPDQKVRLSDRENRRSSMSEEEFMALNGPRALALGVYRTTCAPYPLIIYYSLVEGLEEVRGGDKTFLGEALEQLDELDLDI